MRIMLWVVMVLLMSSLSYTQAQEDTVITVMAPTFIQFQLEEALLRYEETHPDIVVQTLDLPTGSLDVFEQLNDPDTYLDALESLATQADIVFVDRYGFGVEATRTGYFLDLSPLLRIEPEIHERIYPAMWQSFSWDNSTWAVPIYGQPLSIVYNSNTFDEANLPHPTGQWSSTDYISAVRELAQINTPVMFVSELDMPLWLQILSQADFTQEQDGLTVPGFGSPSLGTLIEDWGILAQDGFLTTHPSESTVLRLSRTWDVPTGFEQVPLPGDQIGLHTFGLAISKGTTDPETAFELAVYLSSTPEIVTAPAFTVPANQSISQIEITQSDLLDWIVNARSTPLFTAFVLQAWRDVTSHRTDAADALLTAQNSAERILMSAAERRNNTIIVNPPVTREQSDSSDIILNFGIYTGRTQFVEQPLWENMIEGFVAAEPSVDDVLVIHYPPTREGFERMESISSDMDCFFMPTPWAQDYLGTVLSIDPLLSADPTFGSQDLLPGTLDQVQYEGQTIAFPVSVMPSVLYANEDLFDQAGVTIPGDASTIEGFITALHRLAPLTPDQAPLYPAATMSGSHLLLLIAANGGQPLDLHSQPPIVNFTEPQTLDAIRQILDLARDGYIYYQPTARYIQRIEMTDQPPALLTHTFTSQGPNPESTRGDFYHLMMFPTGRDLIPVSYGFVTAVYISADTQFPEQCYQFARQVVSHPELYMGLPAFRSVIASPITQVTRGVEETAFYQHYADILNQNNVVVVTDYSAQYPWGAVWLKRAFDRYVLEGADLETELMQAEQFTRAYIECEDNPDRPEAPVRGYPVCALQVDPTINDTLNGE